MAVTNNLGSGKYSQDVQEEQSVEVVVAPLNAIEMMERASIDIQIATAHINTHDLRSRTVVTGRFYLIA